MPKIPITGTCRKCKGTGKTDVRKGMLTFQYPCKPCKGTGDISFKVYVPRKTDTTLVQEEK